MSDATGEAETLNVCHSRGGKVVRLVMFANRARSFAALGLEE